MTNYQRIKEMTIEELAIFLDEFKGNNSIRLKDKKKSAEVYVKWLLCEKENPNLIEINEIAIDKY